MGSLGGQQLPTLAIRLSISPGPNRSMARRYKRRSIGVNSRRFGLVVPGTRGIRGVGADSSRLDGVPEVASQGRVFLFNIRDTSLY